MVVYIKYVRFYETDFSFLILGRLLGHLCYVLLYSPIVLKQNIAETKKKLVKKPLLKCALYGRMISILFYEKLSMKLNLALV